MQIIVLCSSCQVCGMGHQRGSATTNHIGKPFLTTNHVLLDLEKEELYLHAIKKQVTFNFAQSMQIFENEEIVRIDLSLLMSLKVISF